MAAVDGAFGSTAQDLISRFRSGPATSREQRNQLKASGAVRELWWVDGTSGHRGSVSAQPAPLPSGLAQAVPTVGAPGAMGGVGMGTGVGVGAGGGMPPGNAGVGANAWMDELAGMGGLSLGAEGASAGMGAGARASGVGLGVAGGGVGDLSGVGGGIPQYRWNDAAAGNGGLGFGATAAAEDPMFQQYVQPW